MKTWRERVAEARERGYFSHEDRMAWMDLTTCPAGEIVRAMPCLNEATKKLGGLYNHELHVMGHALGRCIAGPTEFLFDEADKILDAIEDRALQLKRDKGV